MAPSRLVPWFPHVKAPIIINAPMMITANAALVTEVSKAGGIGTYYLFTICNSNL